MEQYKQEFINFMVESEVLKFGEFTLKSGRKSPFFMNRLGVILAQTAQLRTGYICTRVHEERRFTSAL